MAYDIEDDIRAERFYYADEFWAGDVISVTALRSILAKALCQQELWLAEGINPALNHLAGSKDFWFRQNETREAWRAEATSLRLQIDEISKSGDPAAAAIKVIESNRLAFGDVLKCERCGYQERRDGREAAAVVCASGKCGYSMNLRRWDEHREVSRKPFVEYLGDGK